MECCVVNSSFGWKDRYFVALPTVGEIVLCPYAYNYRICIRLQNYCFFTNPTICNLMDAYKATTESFVSSSTITYNHPKFSKPK
jgi:hypothetical protein